MNAIDISSILNLESWDGYLVELANLFNTSHIYTLDKKLQKLRNFTIVCPVSDEELAAYHSWLTDRLIDEKILRL